VVGFTKSNGIMQQRDDRLNSLLYLPLHALRRDVVVSVNLLQRLMFTPPSRPTAQLTVRKESFQKEIKIRACRCSLVNKKSKSMTQQRLQVLLSYYKGILQHRDVIRQLVQCSIDRYLSCIVCDRVGLRHQKFEPLDLCKSI
jgi:hypothetical protein